LVVPSLARAQIPDSAIPLQTVINETNRFRAEYADSYNAKDVMALTAMYAPDAIVTLGRHDVHERAVRRTSKNASCSAHRHYVGQHGGVRPNRH
jgi:hypothetical protein